MKLRASLSLVIVGVLGLLALCGASLAVDGNEPVAHWKFDETSGTTALDCVGDNNGTVHGAQWTTGQIDGALSFDGNDDYVDLDAHIGDYQNLSEGAVSMWLNNIEDEGGIFFSACRSDALTEIYFAILVDGRLKIRICPLDPPGSLLYWISDDVLPSGWHHFCYSTGTNPSGNWMYLDGEPITGDYTKGNPSTNAFFSHVPNQDNLRIGNILSRGMENREHFNGLIDDVRIYERALSAEEVYEMYFWGLPAYERAIVKIEEAVDEKEKMLKGIDETLEKEGDAYEALGELLESGDFGDLKKGDIVKAKQKVHSAMQHEEQSIDALEKSIEKLYDTLAVLGWEPNLVSHWKFDEGSGTIALDCVGNNDGTIYGATWTTGQIDDALSFDGSGDYIDCGNNASISDVSVFSVSLWFKTNGIPDPWPAPWSYPHMISHRDLSQVFWAFYLHGDWSAKLTGSIFTTGSPAHSVLNFVPDVGTWYHAVMTYDDHGDRKVRVYVDGEELSYALHTSATGTMSSNPSVNIAIGNRIGGGRDWDGIIDDVRIYDRALSAEEIQQLYQEGL